MHINRVFSSRRSLLLAVFSALVIPVSLLRAGEFDEIDRHALNAPPEIVSNLDSLVDYLVRPAHNEVERLRAIFRWITANIVYDSEGFFAAFSTQFETAPTKEKPENKEGAGQAEAAGEALTPEMVLQRRIANCDGYSLLMEAMAKRIQQMTDLTQRVTSLKIVKIKGFAKGFGYRVGSGFDKSNHAWNAVNINGEWKMIDCTWGAGHPDERGQFVSEFEDYYFLTPPAELVYTHYPEDPAWQFIDRKVTKDEFIGLAFLWPAFYKYGMHLNTHPGAIIQTGGEIEISIGAPDSLLLDADLIGGGQLLEGNYTFIQNEQGGSRIKAVFPRPGEYVLRLYSKVNGSEEPYKETLNYKVLASAGEGENIGFPLVYEKFLSNRACLYEPLQGRLKRGAIVSFKIKVPNAANAAVVVDDRWEQLASVDSVFGGEVTVDGASVGIYARFHGSLDYDCLLEYETE
ncbi:MAG: hypothetical protein V1794_09565 [Candidatus Glassbacteria bacterium]